jgi:hypothetical protein
MKQFILLVALLAFSLQIAGAQQTRKLDKEANTETSSLQVENLYADGNNGDYLRYAQMLRDYAAEYDYYIQEVNVKDIAKLRAENCDGYKNSIRVEEAALTDDTKVVSVFTQLNTMEVVHHFSNKPFKEPHIKKINEATAQGPVVRTLKAKGDDAATAQQKDAWNKYLDNVYKGAISQLKAGQKIAGRKKTPLLDNINRDIALLESHNKEHSLFYCKK